MTTGRPSNDSAVTFVPETDDFTRELPESEDKYQEPELSYPSPDDSQPIVPTAVESIPADVFLDSTPSPGPIDVSTLSMREAFLIRSYIQKIAAVVSLSHRLLDMACILTFAGGYL